MTITPRFPTEKALGLFGVLALIALASLRYGAIDLSWTALIDVANGTKSSDAAILMNYRAPRTMAAIVIGIYLGCAGLVFQTVLRNPLADPTLFGVSGGAGLAVVGAMSAALFFSPDNTVSRYSSHIPMTAVPIIALFGALAATALVLLLSGGLTQWRNFSPVRLILTGVIVSAVLNAIVMALVLSVSESQTELAILWLAGSLYGRSFDNILPTLPWGLLGLMIIWVMRRHLSILRFDPDSATALGVAPAQVSLLLLAVAAGLAANAVAVAGTVGFVGLIVPHITRRIMGADVASTLWGCGLIGAILVCGADVMGRCLAPPLEVPVGMMTSLIGAPVLALLIWHLHRRNNNA
ncbi:FecCD family ABC transporter permease [Shimia sp. MMG029]|uniref:FecCD family ABC transporter permease n=1 Tax=Shimia sp. MMG029 TaxID=3021978 RepID=UPI0022FEB720|nr:iron ABC transporter permease [Shimia sp. MMG029]MDA5558703.1 iron ABC transporter permease [Shimia sp. MMG029]